jgi:hypothetical protein
VLIRRETERDAGPIRAVTAAANALVFGYFGALEQWYLDRLTDH